MRWQSAVAALLLVPTGPLFATARDDDAVVAYEQYHGAILRVASLKGVDPFISAAAIERRKAMSEDAQLRGRFYRLWTPA
ncbi:MAG: hypothetical protein A2498_01875 [Lentisphaerae bacterium RIFOXYC12_FULL_60_16]|nr:MAG: hypothetical protein A2498_01875 [Lentisphaerae bacterium RIFOXYC12_FULL_60_16]OGV70297.1 MAG: hypothetical protein A2269_07145 [Lentisphaerae bacterium RIFOXYA12_FULL_60_10]OGV84125.1 MAG: hypothetical protein A2340_13665 [Lentisphaerae bacterium RIFOXYB12_FULL_60_10]